MPAIAVPKSRVLTGAGFLYRAPVGSLLPGQISATVTNKALTSNVVTLTTSAAHGFVTGDQVVVSIGDATFDGLYTLLSGATTTMTYAKISANVVSGVATGTVVSMKAGGTVAGGVFTDAWPAAWIPVGVTKSGHEFSYSLKTGNIEAAEFLLPLKIVSTSAESKISFECMEFTARNFASALNGGTVTTVSGTGATLLTEVTPPDVGAEVRQMFGWEAEDSTERLFALQCLQTGDVKTKAAKGTDNATITFDMGLEQPSIGKPFRRFYAGSVPVGQ
jgi:hypothetical protein